MDPRYQPLFEPITIGPVTAKNRFYQVPHCTGLGWLRPNMVAKLRGVKAQGGWGVVCTEYCSIHPSSDDLPYPYHSLWDDNDIRAHKLMTDEVHEHGALAGVELWVGGARGANLFTREIPFGVSSTPNLAGNPSQTRSMDKADIRALRGWHKKAALRAKQADFDIVYVYATHGYLLSSFLSKEHNHRADEYGGSLENRVRLVRELIEETKDAVGDRCAVAVRFAVDEAGGADGSPIYDEKREMFEMLAELPDLWDINISDYSYEMGVSRYVKEGALEPYMSFVKSATTKPVVTVGRFTSPDTMVSQVRRGIVDFIGAARPSIADPYLPEKIRRGEVERIRECIGCNICYASDGLGIPIRCTQNPTMGEEWRRRWHPEFVPKATRRDSVLIIGAGPAGLEAGRIAGQRGFKVMIAEASRHLGGRVRLESALPGLGEWIRVRDYRIGEIERQPSIEIFRESPITGRDVLDVAADHVVIATGSSWRRDGIGRTHSSSIAGLDHLNVLPIQTVFTPDDIMSGNLPKGRVLIYDDDDYYMASVIAKQLAETGCEVVLVSPSARVSGWSGYTAEQPRVQRELINLDIELILSHHLDRVTFGDAFVNRQVDDSLPPNQLVTATLGCIYTGNCRDLNCDSVVLVTSRLPNDALYVELLDELQSSGQRPFTLSKIGDCDAPSIIADAVFAGHRWARQCGEAIDSDNPLSYDRPVIT